VLAAGLARGWEVGRAARCATAAAALSVTKPGARGGMPAASEIEAMLSRVDFRFARSTHW
jgi:sugar/nucleoside kinase (ribokinase family)